MVNDAIFNGFFRSGTTLAFKILKESNPNSLVFYEPLNKNLMKYASENVGNDFHNADLWGNYATLPDAVLRLNPGLRSVLSHSIDDVSDYLKSLKGETEKRSIYQTNRLHLLFANKNFTSKYRCIHLIRDPLEIYRSFLDGMSRRHKSRPIKHRLAQIYYAHNKNPFELNEMFWEISNNNLNRRYSVFEKFLYVWTKVNFQIIKNPEVLVVTYPELASNNLATFEEIDSFLELGLSFNPLPVSEHIPSANRNFLAERSVRRNARRIKFVLNKLDIADEYNCLLSFISSRKEYIHGK